MTRPGEYEIMESRSGQESLIYHGEKTIRLHSLYDPLKEAKRSVDSFRTGRFSLLIVSGLARGYHVRLLRDRFPHKMILVLERDRKVLEIVTEREPDLLGRIAVAISEEEMLSYLDEIEPGSFRGIAHYVHRPSLGIDPSFYENLLSRAKGYISSRFSDLMTRFEFEELWLSNIFRNMERCKRAIPVSALFGKFRGIPGVIVSAGPSLRKNIEKLKDYRDRALILAVDTAYRALLKSGIQPHIVMTLDAQKHSYKHFGGTLNEETLLCADLVSYPPIIRDYPGPLALSTTAKYYQDREGNERRESTPGTEWFERHITPPGDIQSGGSVATSAFDLLLNLGCAPIILAGQDLAYTGREIHMSGTHHNETWIPTLSRVKTLDGINQAVIRKRKIKRIKAYGGEDTVIADFVFDLYRQWFEDSASRVPVSVINATEGGGRLNGIPETPLGKALSLSAMSDPGSKLRSIVRKTSSLVTGDLKKALTRLLNEFERMEKEMDFDPEKVLAAPAGPLFRPYLRKSGSLLARHQDASPEDGGDDKIREMVSSEIKRAIKEIGPKAKRLLDSLEE